MKGANTVGKEDKVGYGIKVIWKKQEAENKRGFMFHFYIFLSSP